MLRNALRERRAAGGLTQADLAREAGISRPQVAAIEAGRHTPSVTAGLALARALGVPLEELFPSEPSAAVPVVESAPEGAPLVLGRVGDRLVYSALPERRPPPSAAVAAATSSRPTARSVPATR